MSSPERHIESRPWFPGSWGSKMLPKRAASWAGAASAASANPAGRVHHARGASASRITAAPAAKPSQLLRVWVSASAGSRNASAPAAARRSLVTRRPPAAAAPSAHSATAHNTPPEVIEFDRMDSKR